MSTKFSVFLIFLALVGAITFSTPVFAANDPGMEALKAMNIRLDDLGESVTPNTAQAQIRADRVVLKNHNTKISDLINVLDRLTGVKGPIVKAGKTADEALIAANRANQATENIEWLWFFAVMGCLMGMAGLIVFLFPFFPQFKPTPTPAGDSDGNDGPAPAERGIPSSSSDSEKNESEDNEPAVASAAEEADPAPGDNDQRPLQAEEPAAPESAAAPKEDSSKRKVGKPRI